MEFYCLVEKKNVEVPKRKITITGEVRPMAKAVCPSCGRNLSKFIARGSAKPTKQISGRGLDVPGYPLQKDPKDLNGAIAEKLLIPPVPSNLIFTPAPPGEKQGQSYQDTILNNPKIVADAGKDAFLNVFNWDSASGALMSGLSGDLGAVAGEIGKALLSAGATVNNAMSFNDLNKALFKAYNDYIQTVMDTWVNPTKAIIWDWAQRQLNYFLQTLKDFNNYNPKLFNKDKWEAQFRFCIENNIDPAPFMLQYNVPGLTRPNYTADDARAAVNGPNGITHQLYQAIDQTYATLLKNWREAEGHRLSTINAFY